MRLTKEIIPKILATNEGFTRRTYYEGRNSETEHIYKIENGKLLVRSVGKTSWADSRYDESGVCDIDQTRRFLRKHIDDLIIDI